MKAINIPHLILFSIIMLVLTNSIQAQEIIVNITNSCPEMDNGEIKVEISEQVDSPPYNFVWSNLNGDTLAPMVEDTIVGLSILGNLAPGEYCLIITDSADCVAESCELFIENNADIQIEIDDLTCICTPDGFGAINITATGGSGNFEYLWTNQTGTYNNVVEDPTDITEPGTYTVTVIDTETGCTGMLPIPINFCTFTFPTFITTKANSCSAPNSGSIEVSIDVASLQVGAPLIFVWLRTDGPPPSQSQITSDLFSASTKVENLEPGEYCLTVLSDNGCLATQCWSIEEFEPLSIVPTVTPSLGHNGAIDLTVKGGATPLTFQWSNGAQTKDIINLAPGAYCVTVTYGQEATGGPGCSEEMCFQVFDCSGLSNLVLEAAITPMSNKLKDGAIDLSVVNGAGYQFEYIWSNGAKTEDISGLTAGTYCVTVTHPNCPGMLPITGCFEICGFGLTVTKNIIPPGFGQVGCSAVLKATLNPGGNYTFAWSDGTTGATTTVFPVNQEYCVTVTDGNGCEAVSCVTPLISTISASVAVTNTSGSNATGAIDLKVTGGFKPYTFDWDNDGVGDFDDPEDISGLAAGQYCVRIRDNCGITEELCAYVDCKLPQSALTASIVDVNCASQNSGAIDLSIVSELGFNNLFLWSTGETTEDIMGLAAGEYCVTVVNVATNCSVWKCFTVETGGDSNMQINFDSESDCLGGSGGFISANVGGGQPPFSYEWYEIVWTGLSPELRLIPGATGQTLADVSSGWYMVLVTDALGCTESNFTILWPKPGIEVDFDIVPDPVCPGESATVTANAFKGTPPYTYQWANCYPCTPIGSNTPTLNNLQPGLYIVTVSDAEGCLVQRSFSVNEYPEIVVDAEIKDICSGNPNSGAIFLSIIGGTPPYTFLWNDGNIGKDRQNLPEGQYCVTVTDQNNCTAEGCFEVKLTLSPIFVNVTNVQPTLSCEVGIGNCGGAIEIEVTGLGGQFSYVWSGPNGFSANKPNILGLCVGDYSLTVTDQNGCVSTANAFVCCCQSADGGEPGQFEGSCFNEQFAFPLQVSGEITPVIITGNNDGKIDLIVTQGTSNYTYS